MKLYLQSMTTCPAILKSGKKKGEVCNRENCSYHRAQRSEPQRPAIEPEQMQQVIKHSKIKIKAKAQPKNSSLSHNPTLAATTVAATTPKIKAKRKNSNPSLAATTVVTGTAKTLNKEFKNVEIANGKREYQLWCEIHRRLGDEALRYFSLPIDTIETIDKYVIVFNHDGLDLCSEEIQKILLEDSSVLSNIITKVMYGLYLLNSNGIYHLDVKPENIVVNPLTLVPTIIDIGNGHMITDILYVKPCIDWVGNQIKESEYMFYPPMKFFMERCIDELSSSNISVINNLLKKYMDSHIKLLHGILPIQDRLDMISLYDGANPRSIIYQILTDDMALKITRKSELNAWDAYGMGITILTMLNDLRMDNHKLFNIGLRLSHPSAHKRMDFLSALSSLH